MITRDIFENGLEGADAHGIVIRDGNVVLSASLSGEAHVRTFLSGHRVTQLR